ncbi:MAG: hypothetical protein U1G07_02550 [Verrucomicrobiota bacterium]
MISGTTTSLPPNLVQVEHQGRRIDAVAQVGKIGHLFLLDRATGKPLFPVEERPVPNSQIPGEKSWPTQPFPVKPPPFAQQRFTAAEVTDLTPEARADVLARLRTMATGSIFLPPALQPSVTLLNSTAAPNGAAAPLTRKRASSMSTPATNPSGSRWRPLGPKKR